MKYTTAGGSKSIGLAPEDLRQPRNPRRQRNEVQQENRRQMHVICEHRRRNAIQTGLCDLKDAVERDVYLRNRQKIPESERGHTQAVQPDFSRVEVLLNGVKLTERLKLETRKLEMELMMIVEENARLKRLQNLQKPQQLRPARPKGHSLFQELSNLLDGADSSGP